MSLVTPSGKVAIYQRTAVNFFSESLCVKAPDRNFDDPEPRYVMLLGRWLSRSNLGGDAFKKFPDRLKAEVWRWVHESGHRANKNLVDATARGVRHLAESFEKTGRSESSRHRLHGDLESARCLESTWNPYREFIRERVTRSAGGWRSAQELVKAVRIWQRDRKVMPWEKCDSHRMAERMRRGLIYEIPRLSGICLESRTIEGQRVPGYLGIGLN